MSFSVKGVDADPDPLRFEIDVISNGWTETEVPTLDILVENTGDETATWTGAGAEFAFPKRRVVDSIQIGLEGEVTPRLLDKDGCARMERGIDRDDLQVMTELVPGNSIKQRYVIAGIDSALRGSCPSPGTYRTESMYGGHGECGFEFELAEA